MHDATDHARKAIAEWTGLGVLSPEVAVIVAAFEQAAPRLAQVIHTGYGSVTVKIHKKQLVGVEWQQAIMFG